MRPPTILLATALCAAVVTPVYTQLRIGGRSCSGSGDGGATISFEDSFVRLDSLAGAPYSGVNSNQSVQTLPDGTHLTHNARTEIATWRDSAGRVRTETRVPEGARPRPCESELVEVSDPVAGYGYLLDRAGQVAYRLAAGPAPAVPAAQKAASRPVQTAADTPTVSMESLGEKTISGVSVTGTRRTTTYPVHYRNMGNDRPVTDTEENWMSAQLNLLVYSQRTAYTGIVTTTTVKDLSVAEPDPSLFQIPAGYKIIDESGSFTINIPGHN